MNTGQLERDETKARRRGDQARGIAIGVAIILLVLVLGWLTISASQADEARQQANQREVHALTVLLAANGVLRAAQEAETGQRGFLLARDAMFLDAFERGRRNLPQALARLRSLTQDNESQAATVVRVEDLAERRMRQMERSIALMRADSFDRANLADYLKVGKQTMDSLRRELSLIETGERKALAERQANARQAELLANRWRTVLAVFSIALCALCALAIIAMFRAWRESREQRLLAQSTMALAQGRHLLQTIIDASGDAIFVKNRDRRVLYVNKRLEEIVRRPMAELHGVPLPPATQPEEAALLAEADRVVLQYGERRTVEEHLEVDGVPRVFHTDKIPWVRDGAIEGVIGIARDVTEMKAREAELERRVAERTRELASALDSVRHEMAEREAAEETIRQMQRIESLGQMTGGIAHDFNNMLAVITGSLEVARHKLGDSAGGPAVIPLIENARAGANRAAQLTARLLAFARQQPLAPQHVDINALIARTSELLARTLGGNIAIELQLDPTAGWTLVDPAQLESALVNLAVNARDAMPQGGRLTIATRREGEDVLITVQDTGSGMSQADLSRAFEPFFTTKELGKGTGLGLSQVHGFVVQSGGRVSLDSMPEEGTTVRLSLPACEAAPAVPKPETALATRPGNGETVLLVEDEGLVRISVQASLEALGYAVVAVADAQQALRALADTPTIALMITDMAMPGMDGRELAETAGRMRPQMPILLTTGYEHRKPANENTPVLVKPYVLEDLASAIGKALG